MSAASHEQLFFGVNIGATAQVVVDGAVHISAPLVQGGRYRAICPDASVYVRQGGAGITATVADRLLPRGESFFVNVDDTTNNRIAVMTADGNGGFLRVTRIDDQLGSAGVHRAQWFTQVIGVKQDLVDNGAGATSTALVQGGRYLLVCLDTDVYVLQGDAGVVCDANQMPLMIGEEFFVNVDDATNNHIAFLSTGAVPVTLQVLRVDTV